MTDSRPAAVESQRLQKGVFQPSRAEITREMKCRLNLKDTAPDERSSPEGRQPTATAA